MTVGYTLCAKHYLGFLPLPTVFRNIFNPDFFCLIFIDFIHPDLLLDIFLEDIIMCIQLLKDYLIFGPLNLIVHLGIINEFVKEENLSL